MSERKKKTCKECNKEMYIYARGMCQYCYQKDYATRYAKRQRKRPKQRIKPISDKMASKLKIYRKERDKYMKDNPTCEARLPSCTFRSTDLHHKKKRRGSNLYNPKYFMSLCRSCHTAIEERMSFEEAERLGFRVRSV